MVAVVDLPAGALSYDLPDRAAPVKVPDAGVVSAKIELVDNGLTIPLPPETSAEFVGAVLLELGLPSVVRVTWPRRPAARP